MANRPQVKIGVKISNYSGVASLAQQVHDSMLAGILLFPAPIPSLATFQTNINTLVAAIAAWGPVGNRGSHADLVALRAACLVVYTDMILLAAYVQNLVDPTDSYPDQTTFILASGFSVKNAATPQGMLASPEGLIQLIQPSIPLQTPKLKWSKPIGLLSAGNVKSYKVYRQSVNLGAPTEVIGFPTKTSFIDESATGGTQYNYWVSGINSAGEGVQSAPILISVPL